ncbi:hypothetical protein ACUV8E_004809 [Escherichia coli]
MNNKILITGSCWLEITGLWHLLSEKGYNVTRAPIGYHCAKDYFDLTVIALSAEKIPGWGRYISEIRNIKQRMLGDIVVLVPERLKDITLLQDICNVYSGYEDIDMLAQFIHDRLNGDFLCREKIRLTKGQLQVVNRTLEMPRFYYDRKLYYHQGRLAKNIGVKNLRLLMMTGLIGHVTFWT